MRLELYVNGQSHRVRAEPGTPLLYILRNELRLTAAKFGCSLEQCLACAVIVDGEAVPSCVAPVETFVGRRITTCEGLGTVEHPHRVQRAFIEEQAAQCGYCIPGMVVRAAALLSADPRPSDAAIREAFAGHICRCGSHPRIVSAVKRAADDPPS